MPDFAAKGIDISEFNGDVDIAGLRGKVDFIIIRCGYGGDYPGQDDAQFENNVRKCVAAGIPYGVYLYSYAKNTDMARSEADHTLRLLRNKRPLYGVWYDVEDSSLPTGEVLVDNCVLYCDTLRKAGYYSGIYSFLGFFESRLNSPKLDRFDKWVAQWNNTLDYRGNVGIWQYSDSGVINGAKFDLDRAFRDYPRLTEEMGETTMTREEVAALARKEAQKVYDKNETRFRTVESVPAWAREAVRKVYRELGLAGTGGVGDGTVIDAGLTYVRALYVMARLLERLEGEAPPEEDPGKREAPTENVG